MRFKRLGRRSNLNSGSDSRQKTESDSDSKTDLAIDVAARNHQPVYIYIRGLPVRVLAIVNIWVDQGQWWEAEEKRVFYTCITETGTITVCRRTYEDGEGAEWLYHHTIAA